MRRLWSESPVVAGRWTLREVVRGKPLRHPSHPLFVHFPAALPLAAFAFDIASRVHADLTLPRAAFYNLAFALGMTLPAAVTGLVDYLPMVPGSRKRRLGTYHLLCQLSAAALFAASLAIRLLDYDARQRPRQLLRCWAWAACPSPSAITLAGRWSIVRGCASAWTS